jgi:hypothetical protein
MFTYPKLKLDKFVCTFLRCHLVTNIDKLVCHHFQEETKCSTKNMCNVFFLLITRWEDRALVPGLHDTVKHDCETKLATGSKSSIGIMGTKVAWSTCVYSPPLVERMRIERETVQPFMQKDGVFHGKLVNMVLEWIATITKNNAFTLPMTCHITYVCQMGDEPSDVIWVVAATYVRSWHL